MKQAVFFCSVILTGSFLIAGSCSQDEQDSPEKLGKASPIVLKSEYRDKTVQDNDFAFDLLKATLRANDKPNVFISPLSVSMALSMTLNGARGETAEEMFRALRLNGYTMDQVNDYNKTLREALLKVDHSTELNIANSIWNKSGFPFIPAFINTNQTFYNAEIRKMNFSDPSTLTTINNWCSDATNGKIPKVLDVIPADAVSYLINAVYFKGIWQAKFEKKNTDNEPFTTEAGSRQTVPMMKQTEEFAYASTANGGYLQLPYGNGAFNMVVLLPQAGKSVSDMLNELNPETWNNLNYRTCKVNLKLPRFKAECSYNMEQTILPSMGMLKAFNPIQANFSGMSDIALFISKVIHKTFVEVNEKGTEAAAVTVVEMELTAFPSEPEEIDFVVDKPFLFLIRENSTGVILFAGKMGEIEE
ncbi:MAG: serpin family protein [Prolixibacteraceae bacterium]